MPIYLRWSVFCVVAALGLAAPTAGFAAELRVVFAVQGQLDGNLSADGTTIGIGAATSSNFALLETPSGTTTLVPVAGVATTPVVSADGSTVYGTSNTQGAYRFQNGVLETNLPTGAAAVFLDISNDGTTLVGGFSSAFVSDGTTVTPLAGLGAGDSSASAISGNGSVIGGFSTSASGQEATLWTGGTPTGIGDLPGGLFLSEVRDLSLDGSVAVGLAESALGTEAFRWEGGVMESLGRLGATGDTFANAVSGDGSTIVGRSGFDAFIWREGLGMERLSDVLAASGVDLSNLGYTLSEAISISEDGRTILGVGSADSIDSPFFLQTVLWVATIPEPGVSVLLILGCLAAGLTRGRR